MPFAQSTVQLGTLVAQAHGSDVTLLTVLKKGHDEQAARESLEAACASLEGVESSVLIRHGDPMDEILKAGRSEEIETIVVGSKDVIRLLDRLLGTISEDIAHQAARSVMVTKGDKNSIERILVCIGGGRLNEDLIRRSAKLAAHTGAEATLLYVTSPVPSMYTGLATIEETLTELLQSNTPVAHHLRWSAGIFAEAGVKAELELRHGVAYHEIVARSAEGDFDLVVLGAPAPTASLQRVFMDQVAPYVIEHAPCSVLVVR